MNFTKKYKDWTLFLDRDGVLNERIPGAYVTEPSDFHFLPSVLEVMPLLAACFPRIVVVTNQQGIGKGLMTDADLAKVHEHMRLQIVKAGGRIDGIYYCPKLATENALCRKPNPGMAQQAKLDFPAIDFKRSIMVGDSISDMEFGLQLGMQTVYLPTKKEELERGADLVVDFRIGGLSELVKVLD